MQRMQEQLLNLFSAVANLPVSEIRTDVNFFEEGYIDSFAVIELIADVEDLFFIKFTNEDFLDRRFASIEGLLLMIKERVNEGK